MYIYFFCVFVQIKILDLLILGYFYNMHIRTHIHKYAESQESRLKSLLFQLWHFTMEKNLNLF